MKIAIIDGMNQDIGLNIIFPDADYFIYKAEVDKSFNMNKYSIVPRTDIEIVNDRNYDILFIIISLYDAKPGTRFFKQNIKTILDKELDIINNNHFKKVFLFDNYDYDYDPNEIIQCNKIDLFFKRNYNKQKIYNKNVVPFPFIMFGQVSIIEKILEYNLNSPKLNRIFFSGTLFNHLDEQIGYVRDRRSIYNKINESIYNPGKLSYDRFLTEIRNSKYSLDLNGVGDPNKRTFEILSQGSLRISEYNDLKWPFEDDFNDELKFKDEHEFYKIIEKCNEEPDFYNKCLDNQNKIYKKYFNLEWFKDYIINKINE
jgi:hypothetical protein